MTSISVYRAVKLFGIVEGVRFWIKWRIIVPTELFYYKHISHKRWCRMYGYKCKNPDCGYPHYDKPLILRRRKNRVEDEK